MCITANCPRFSVVRYTIFHFAFKYGKRYHFHEKYLNRIYSFLEFLNATFLNIWLILLWWQIKYSSVYLPIKAPTQELNNFMFMIVYMIVIPRIFLITSTLHTLIVTFPFVIFLMLKPTVGIISSLN